MVLQLGFATKSLMVRYRVGVHFGNDQRHAIIHPVVVAVIDDEAPALTASQPNIWLAPFAPSVPAKNAMSFPVEGLRGCGEDVVFLAVNGLFPRASRQYGDLACGRIVAASAP